MEKLICSLEIRPYPDLDNEEIIKMFNAKIGQLTCELDSQGIVWSTGINQQTKSIEFYLEGSNYASSEENKVHAYFARIGT